MSIEAILVGLVAIVIGAAWAAYGLKAFTVLLPVWGFFVGALAGAALVEGLVGDGFFQTVTSWLVAIIVGIGFALISYFVFYGAVIILGASLGYALGSGLLEAVGLDGLLATIAGLAGGALLALAFMAANVPAMLVIVLTALSGAAAVVNGALILLGRVQLEDIGTGLAEGLLRDGVIAVAAWIVIAAAGIAYQVRDTGELARGTIDRSEYRVS